VPTISTVMRTDVRASPVTPTAIERRSLAAATSELSTPATVIVTDMMTAASSTRLICSPSRGGRSAISMATNRPSTTHHSIDGTRTACRKRLLSFVWPVHRRKPTKSACRNINEVTTTATETTAGQKRGDMACMLS
jgi:hypothetical protein